MKLSEWAKREGIHYQTAWRWVKKGKMPVPFVRTPTGAILVEDPTGRPSGTTKNGVALYARVSSSEQKADLERQLGRLAVYSASRGLMVTQTVSEIGSGLNGHRSKLNKLLRDPSVSVIVVEHRGRLARFGSEYIESALMAGGRELLVIETNELEDELVQDMIDILTSFCARLYGRRSAKNRARKALQAAAGGDD